jgi:hypothetical protein
MASENEIVIDAKVNKDEASQGVQDLFAEIEQMKDEIETVGETGTGVAEGLGSAFGGINLTSLIGTVGALGTAFEVTMQIIEECNTALERQTEVYDKATSAYSKYLDQKERDEKLGKTAPDRLGSSLAENLPKELRKEIEALGAQDMGFEKEGTWTRMFQNWGSSVSDFVGGDDTQADMFRRGKEVADRQRNIDKNNEEFADKKKKEAEFWAEEDAAEERRYQAKLEKEKKERQKQYDEEDKRAVQQGRDALAQVEQIHKLEEQKDRKNQAFARQEEMRALSRDKPVREKEFKSQIESLEATYNRIAGAAASDKEDPVEKLRMQQKEIAEKQDALRKQWHDEDVGKIDELIEKIKVGLG